VQTIDLWHLPKFLQSFKNSFINVATRTTL